MTGMVELRTCGTRQMVFARASEIMTVERAPASPTSKISERTIVRMIGGVMLVVEEMPTTVHKRMKQAVEEMRAAIKAD